MVRGVLVKTQGMKPLIRMTSRAIRNLEWIENPVLLEMTIRQGHKAGSNPAEPCLTYKPMTDKNIVDKAIKKAIKQYGKVFIALAHYDTGKKVKGCDCPFCKEKPSEVRG